jgi:hypothetical protein
MVHRLTLTKSSLHSSGAPSFTVVIELGVNERQYDVLKDWGGKLSLDIARSGAWTGIFEPMCE